MLSKKNIQYIRSLGVKKYRQKYHKYFAEGEKICLEIIYNADKRIDHLFGEEGFIGNYKQLLEDKNVPYSTVSSKELKKISQLKTPNGVLCVINMDVDVPDEINFNDQKVLYLDQVQDPGNLGTLIRTADWFGIDRVVLGPSCVDIYNPKVVQASMGSIFRQAFSVMELTQLLDHSPLEYQIYFAEMEGENAFSIEFETPLILVLGNESHGVSLQQANLKNRRSISIPKKSSETESLNVAVAGSILIAEICRE